MGWTKWRRIASGREWFNDTFDYDGPACYELSIAGPRGGDQNIVYVGETGNERQRIQTYAQNGSHLSEIIAQHLGDGWHLYYRGWSHRTKKAAKAMQERLLAKHDYDWNLIGN